MVRNGINTQIDSFGLVLLDIGTGSLFFYLCSSDIPDIALLHSRIAKKSLFCSKQHLVLTRKGSSAFLLVEVYLWSLARRPSPSVSTMPRVNFSFCYPPDGIVANIYSENVGTQVSIGANL